MTETGIGQELRRAREHLGLTLDDVSQATKIRVRYLEALEQEDWGRLPPRVYAIGFLKLYARHVGLDGDALAARLAPPPPEPEPVTPPPSSAPPANRSLDTPVPPRRSRERLAPLPRPARPPSVWAAGIIVLAAAVGAMLLLIHHQQANVPPSTARTPPVAGRHPHHATHPQSNPTTGHHGHHRHHHRRTGSVTAPTLQSATPTLLAYTVPRGPVTVSLSFTSRCWVEEWIDGVNQGTGGTIYNAGTTVVFHARHMLEFRFGNPRAVSATIDGTSIGLVSQGTNGAPRNLLVTATTP